MVAIAVLVLSTKMLYASRSKKIGVCKVIPSCQAAYILGTTEESNLVIVDIGNANKWKWSLPRGTQKGGVDSTHIVLKYKYTSLYYTGNNIVKSTFLVKFIRMPMHIYALNNVYHFVHVRINTHIRTYALTYPIDTCTAD